MNSRVFSTLRTGLGWLVFGLFSTPAAQAQPDVTLMRNGSPAVVGTYTFTTADSSLNGRFDGPRKNDPAAMNSPSAHSPEVASDAAYSKDA